MKKYTLLIIFIIFILVDAGILLNIYLQQKKQPTISTVQSSVTQIPTLTPVPTLLSTDIPKVQLSVLNTAAFLQPFIQTGYISDKNTPFNVQVTGTQQASGDKGIIEYWPSKIVISSSYSSSTSGKVKTLTVGITPDFAKISSPADQLLAEKTLWQAILRSVWHTTHPHIASTDDTNKDLQQFIKNNTPANNSAVVSVTASM